MSETIDLTHYPQALKELAEKMNLPVPKENTAQREAVVLQLVDTLIRQ